MSPSPTSRLRRSLGASISGDPFQFALLLGVAGCSRPRRSAGEPYRYRQLGARALAFGLEVAPLHDLQAAVGEPLLDQRPRQPEPLVRELLAQKLELMRREIDD